MKKISSVITATLFATLLFAGVAQAQSSCTISGPTGPNSNNQCVNNHSTTCTVTNTNTVNTSNTNSQTSSSGSTNNSGNTSGGGATSGSASNSNSTNTNVSITNGGCAPSTTSTPPGSTTPEGGTVSGVSTSTEADQVSAPVGGVGAGVGGMTVPLLGTSIVSIALGFQRLRKLSYAQAE